MSAPVPRLKVLTVVGTRPEIIRLSAVIKRLDEHVDHVLVHTGQNYDYELNEVFFEDLGLRRPDHFLEADTSSLGAVLGSILTSIEKVLVEERPDAFLVLGDTNSSISAVIAKRMKIPVFHMEAGNRSFDENVPEETNRRLVDHVADYNLVYTEHARRNLLAEGLHPSRIVLTGSPMREVLLNSAASLKENDVLSREGLEKGAYFLVSLHREENVDNDERLRAVLDGLRRLSSKYELPVLVSTHPRTRLRIDRLEPGAVEGLMFHKPFGFRDFLTLQVNARIVLSDSGTISEEASLLGFPAVTLRDDIERPEALDSGHIITAGVSAESLVDAVDMVLALGEHAPATPLPQGYEVSDTSRRVLSYLRSKTHTHHARLGIRRDWNGGN
ncbi:non-hydrolyzing UDP-N-acetylglucosamine 2-epimerase [Frigoribacterium sp. VKM Ac-2530]|uniref:non-hydrolyzing UDP-N-acetylglucosamine 2-epimerase n=1 Tax=Frigoribacterium sp. VKM Ac-2530 TaxID=2783822 RepID=UPI00188B4A1A|nr:UDP-N-acetylglucosamine 2-epimerase (non-hydrolyzing) [Frigoribacterium sp. VKM Ac-2530]MBF4578671.1 UDP-N-acetylglucosamine 2-epimerase (non-hydrolyzing) [Frigoribacterium sp. VKM Ac-2530]